MLLEIGVEYICTDDLAIQLCQLICSSTFISIFVLAKSVFVNIVPVTVSTEVTCCDISKQTCSALALSAHQLKDRVRIYATNPAARLLCLQCTLIYSFANGAPLLSSLFCDTKSS